jgi:hypothetical protein
VRLGLGISAALMLSVGLAACGGGDEHPLPPGPLAETLSEVGGNGEHGSLGVGWTDPALARRAGVGPRLMAGALGPNAGSVVEAAPILRRRYALDPLSARRLVSVGGSYAFGLRLEGVRTQGLQDALVGAGGDLRRVGDTDLVDVGGYAQMPEPLLSSGVFGLGARDAFGAGFGVLAISDTSRAALLGRGDRLIDEPVYRAAARCLDDAVAARLIPDKLLLSVEVGIELVGVGVERDREVLCVLGGTAERAHDVAAALRASLAPGARDPRTGEPMSELVTEVEVKAGTYEGVQVVRAELTPVGGRGFFFGAIARGSLVQLINGP